MNFKKSFYSSLIALVLACGAASTYAQTKQVVRFHEFPGSIASLVGWVMRDKGFCDKQGLDCQPVLLASGPLSQQAAAAGSVDLIISSSDVMMQAVAKGNDLQILGAVVSNNIYSLSVSSGVNQPNRAAGYPGNMKDLVDKKIGVTARGSSTEMFVKAMFAGAGLSHDNVTFIAVGGPAAAFAAMSAKQIDAVLSWDPVPALCDATKVCNVAVDFSKGEGPDVIKALNGGFIGWWARREYVEKNGTTIDRFLKAQSEAMVWLRNPANATETMALTNKYLKLSDLPNREQVLNQMVKNTINNYVDKLDRKVITGFNNFLLSNKVIDKPLDANTLVYKNAP